MIIPNNTLKSNNIIPYSLVFGEEVLIPIEIESPSARSLKFCFKQNDRLLWESLLLMENLWDVTSHEMSTIKEQLPTLEENDILISPATPMVAYPIFSSDSFMNN